MTRLVAVYLLSHAVFVAPVFAQSASVPHYEGVVTLGPAADRVAAVLRIRIRMPPDAEYRFLIGRTFTISAIEADAADVSVSDTDQPFPGILQAIVLKTGAGSPRDVTLRLTYAGILVRMQEPPINSVSKDLIELSVDSWWLPYPSNLNSGLTAEVAIKGIPANFTVVSTGSITNTEGAVNVRLDHPNDLALIAAPNLRERRDGRFVFCAEDPDSELAVIYRKHGKRALEELEARYGPIPGGAARVIVVPRAAPNGYNRRGYFVVSARGSKTSELALAMSLVHEIAHSWWSKAGFLGPDYWLVEGPAEYSGFRYGRKHFGEEAMAPRIERARSIAAKAGPIVRHGRSPDAAVYSKAMLVLADLERRIGIEKIDRVLRRVAAAAEHTTAAFLDVLAEEAGQDVAADLQLRLTSPD